MEKDGDNSILKEIYRCLRMVYYLMYYINCQRRLPPFDRIAFFFCGNATLEDDFFSLLPDLLTSRFSSFKNDGLLNRVKAKRIFSRKLILSLRA